MIIKKFNYTISGVSYSNLENYIKKINIYSIITIKEEKTLTKQLYYENNVNSAKYLILSHLRFVIHVARSYSGYGLSQLDLIQEGNIGLIKAVGRFNPTFKVRLVSFAIHWIKAEIHEYVLRNWKIVKIATTKSQRKLFFNLRKIKRKLGWLNKKETNLVAKELKVLTKDVCEMESRMFIQDITYNTLPKFNIYEIYKILPIIYFNNKLHNFTNFIENENWNDHTIEKLNTILGKLDERSKNIIYERWLTNQKSTLHNIASKYGLSAERIRQIEKIAMNKIYKTINKNYKYIYFLK